MSRGGDEEVNLMGGGCSGICTIQGTMVNTDGNGGEISNSGERQRDLTKRGGCGNGRETTDLREFTKCNV